MGSLCTLSGSLLNTLTNKKGLLWETHEYAGVINFKDVQCRLVDNKRVCDKQYIAHNLKKGKLQSVMPPPAPVNFHTHPHACYVDHRVIWGWPSGEDMVHCLRNSNVNICHFVFTLEGTYAIEVLCNIKDSTVIDEIGDLIINTHQFRKYKVKPSEFAKFIGMAMTPRGQNCLELWLHFINNINVSHLKVYGYDCNTTKCPKGALFRVTFFPNESVQHSKISNSKIFKTLVENPIIGVPDKVQIMLQFK
jgi:hypothetical protein